MDIKTLAGAVSSNKGLNPDVKNRGISALTAEAEPAKGKDLFANLLTAEDAPPPSLLADTTTLTLVAGELPVLAQQPQNFIPPPPVAMVYSATATLLSTDSKIFESTDMPGGVTPLVSSPVSVPTSLQSMIRRVEDGVSVKPAVLVSEAPWAKPDALPFALPEVELSAPPVEGRTTVSLAGFVTPLPWAGAHRQVSVDAVTDLEKQLAKTLPTTGAAISLLASESNSGPILVPARVLKPTVRAGNFAGENLNVSSTAAPWALNEVGKKNEALLDVLALGGRLKVTEGLTQALKPEAYAFQREAIVDTAPPRNQSLAPSPSLAADPSPVSDKNGYWLASSTQNVSLTLSGPGDEAVAVKISVSGLETQVDIRTDQLALRQLIEGSVQEMKDQLSTEGLTLSGLSVGTSSQDQIVVQATGLNTGMSTGAQTGQSMGKNSHRQALPEDSSSQTSNQSTSSKNRVTLVTSRVLPEGGRKLSVFV